MTTNRQWSTKYRPQDIDGVVGNDSAKKEVLSVLKRKDAHCILFHGPSGCGKTTLAYIVAHALVGKFKQDLIEHNVGGEGGVNEIRAVVEQAKFLPRGDCKVIVLEEAHALTGQSRAAVLRPIEEPAHDKLVWILVTDQPWKLEKAILDRCKAIEVKPPEEEELARYLLKVMRKEKDFDAIDNKKHRQRIAIEVVRASRNIPRAAIQLLHSLSSQLDDENLDIKSLIVNSIRKSAEATMDKAALQMIMAIHSREKTPKFRAQYLLSQIGSHNVFALLNRMIYINHCLFMDAGGVRVPAAYYHKKELEPTKAVPTMESAMTVALFLSELRQSLEVINIDPNFLIIPKLVNLIMSQNTKDDDDD